MLLSNSNSSFRIFWVDCVGDGAVYTASIRCALLSMLCEPFFLNESMSLYMLT